MIDDKKIEEAIEDYVKYSSVEDEYPGTEGEAFRQGVDWAINEFLQDLWHPANEEPSRKGKPILFSCIDSYFGSSWCVYPIGFQGNWNYFCKAHWISRWLYIDDLFLNERR